MLGYRMITCLFVCLCLCLRWTWGLVCLVPRRLKCVGKTEHTTSGESIAQWTMGTLSVDAKDVGKGERLSHNTMIQSLSNPLERAWVRGKKLVLPLAKQILNVSKEVVESAIFIHTIECLLLLLLFTHLFDLTFKQSVQILFVCFFFLAVGVTQTTKSFYKAVHSVITKVLTANGYSEVNLSKLFSSFFV